MLITIQCPNDREAYTTKSIYTPSSIITENIILVILNYSKNKEKNNLINNTQ